MLFLKAWYWAGVIQWASLIQLPVVTCPNVTEGAIPSFTYYASEQVCYRISTGEICPYRTTDGHYYRLPFEFNTQEPVNCTAQ